MDEQRVDAAGVDVQDAVAGDGIVDGRHEDEHVLAVEDPLDGVAVALVGSPRVQLVVVVGVPRQPADGRALHVEDGGGVRCGRLSDSDVRRHIRFQCRHDPSNVPPRRVPCRLDVLLPNS